MKQIQTNFTHTNDVKKSKKSGENEKNINICSRIKKNVCVFVFDYLHKFENCVVITIYLLFKLL